MYAYNLNESICSDRPGADKFYAQNQCLLILDLCQLAYDRSFDWWQSPTKS